MVPFLIRLVVDWRLQQVRKLAARPRETLIRICHNLPMCGRYRLSRRKKLVEEYFDSVAGGEDWSPRYNIAPTQPVPVIRQNPTKRVRELSLMRWGLIPSWAKDSSVAAQMINARSETVSTKPARPEDGESQAAVLF